MKDVSIVVITGMSGSGKSIALRALEDIGYFCIDNLPISLLPKLLELSKTTSELTRFALVMDVRGPMFLSDFDKTCHDAMKEGYHIKIVFLDANDMVLLRRFSETRRKHPLDREGALEDSIRLERLDFDHLKEIADLVIDTSTMSVHTLRQTMQEKFGAADYKVPIHISLVSFGYKNGVPTDANIVIDVRFLPNPYFVPELKDLTGLDASVADFVLSRDVTRQFLEYYGQLLSFLLPYYEKEGKHYLTIGVGCTGGRHRSVAIVEALAARMPESGHLVTVTHRELNQHRVHSQIKT
jgi:RNase adapter protein RapZ